MHFKEVKHPALVRQKATVRKLKTRFNYRNVGTFSCTTLWIYLVSLNPAGLGGGGGVNHEGT